jgi:hypothetical protein
MAKVTPQCTFDTKHGMVRMATVAFMAHLSFATCVEASSSVIKPMVPLRGTTQMSSDADSAPPAWATSDRELLQQILDGQNRINNRLKKLEKGQKKIEVRLEKQEEGQKKLKVRLEKHEEGQKKLQTEIWETAAQSTLAI